MELVSPAGDEQCLRAAVANGADAVYFGLSAGFHARARAASITPEDLPRLTDWLHRRQVKGYVTVNTLVFPDELEAVEQLIRRIAAGGADAIVVQDLGVARLARAVCPELPLHASTQMTLTSAENIRAAAALGISRVVLPRELSLDEIAAIHRQTPIELEVFVHGALCIAYGGQCLASLAMGGRSANRGQCAQACRLPYELIVDGRPVDLGPKKYLYSPQDLAAYDLLPELRAAGAAALKIEGRLKTPEYVATITRHYRQAVDAAMKTASPARTPLAPREEGHHAERDEYNARRAEEHHAERDEYKLTPEQIEEMEMTFTRGFSHGWLAGHDHAGLVPGLSSANRGVRLGRVLAVRRGRVAVELERGVQRGDGVVFAADRAEGDEPGGRVYEIFRDGQPVEAAGPGVVELAFGREAIDLGRLRPGQLLWKTDDPQLTRRLRKTFEGRHVGRPIPLDIVVEAQAGRPLTIAVQTPVGLACRVESPGPLEAAVKHALTPDVLREQLGRLGGTEYELRSLDARIAGRPMVPLSVLGKLRHEIVRQLDACPLARKQWTVRTDVHYGQLIGSAPHPDPLPEGEGDHEHATPTLHVLCRRPEQVPAVLAAGVRSVMADFRDIDDCVAAIETARAAGAEIFLATPRIQKPGEMEIFERLRDCRPDGLLVRNLAGIAFCADQGLPMVADFSLNATNPLTVTWLRDRGARRVTVGCDLDARQTLDLAAAVPPEWLEMIVFRHTPLFHTEHCLFCGLVAGAADRSHCGQACRRHAVRIRDRLGEPHVLLADAACRNTLYHARAEEMTGSLSSLVERGVRHLRVELLDDAADMPIIRRIGLR